MAQAWKNRAAAMAEWARSYALEKQGWTLSDEAVAALASVPRHVFMPSAELELCYALEERPNDELPDGQPVSQAPMVAVLAHAVGAELGTRVLEIGLGSGYQAAVMTAMGAQVFSVEVRDAVIEAGKRRLRDAGLEGEVQTLHADGRGGWTQEAPFDGIVATAGFKEIPPAWEEQLRVGGTLVVPLAHGEKHLLHVRRKTTSGWEQIATAPCWFVDAL